MRHWSASALEGPRSFLGTRRILAPPVIIFTIASRGTTPFFQNRGVEVPYEDVNPTFFNILAPGVRRSLGRRSSQKLGDFQNKADVPFLIYI